jgi:hypothetical protein
MHPFVQPVVSLEKELSVSRLTCYRNYAYKTYLSGKFPVKKTVPKGLRGYTQYMTQPALHFRAHGKESQTRDALSRIVGEALHLSSSFLDVLDLEVNEAPFRQIVLYYVLFDLTS